MASVKELFKGAVEKIKRNQHVINIATSLASFWCNAKWISLGFIGLTVSMGSANYAATGGERAYWIPAVLNLALYAWYIRRGIKKSEDHDAAKPR